MCAEAPPFIHMRCINEEEEGRKEYGLRVPLPCETTLVREGHRRVTVLYCTVQFNACLEPTSGRRETHLHESVVVDLHPAAAVRVMALERLGQCLDHHTGTHEAVERNATCASTRTCRWHTACARTRRSSVRIDWRINVSGQRRQSTCPSPLLRTDKILTVLLRNNVKQLGRESIAKRLKCVRQLVLVDRARAILVKVSEDALPVLNVLP